MELACPRCRLPFNSNQFGVELPADLSNGPHWLPCPLCGFEFTFSDFETQASRERLIVAWPNRPSAQVGLRDQLMDSTQGRMGMSLGEWFRSKIGNQKTRALLALRNDVHRMVQAAAGLGLLYPAIPRDVVDTIDVEAFWVDPDDCCFLYQVESLAWMATRTMRYCIAQGWLNHGETRQVVESQIPRVHWAIIGLSYVPWAPELRGLLFAMCFLDALGKPLPNILAEIRRWVYEAGWDKYGHTLRVEESA